MQKPHPQERGQRAPHQARVNQGPCRRGQLPPAGNILASAPHSLFLNALSFSRDSSHEGNLGGFTRPVPAPWLGENMNARRQELGPHRGPAPGGDTSPPPKRAPEGATALPSSPLPSTHLRGALRSVLTAERLQHMGVRSPSLAAPRLQGHGTHRQACAGVARSSMRATPEAEAPPRHDDPRGPHLLTQHSPAGKAAGSASAGTSPTRSTGRELNLDSMAPGRPHPQPLSKRAPHSQWASPGVTLSEPAGMPGIPSATSGLIGKCLHQNHPGLLNPTKKSC